MNRSLIVCLGLLVTAVTGSGCNRPDGAIVGGKGGNATLKVVPKHHAVNIDSCKVYIKYNTLETPVSYDDSTVVVQENGVPVATFTGLKKGMYYLFGRGWDGNALAMVKGGIPYTITEEKLTTLTLPVSEDH